MTRRVLESSPVHWIRTRPGIILGVAGTVVVAAVLVFLWYRSDPVAEVTHPEYIGSAGCRDCHEEFYQRWSTSHHGRAMQPISPELAEEFPADQDGSLVGDRRYRWFREGNEAFVLETGPTGETRFPVLHAMGGKNVYYFLTPLEKGRLQVLPIAFDVNRQKWYDTAASGVRHFPAGGGDEPVHWRDPAYTFNTSCHSCHVSQLESNFDLESNSYRTTWKEPGINCETCHGPAGRHDRIARSLPEGAPLEDPEILSIAKMTPAQRNTLCASCHAKMSLVTATFPAGASEFFDHFDLVLLDHPDFYPDGRDLGENFTYSTWLLSPCLKAEEFDCVFCHTSSGRYRFADPQAANQACLPCHAERVADPVPHTHHPVDSAAGRCISCHMPKTSFARMNRTDHSMLPPTPRTTIEFGSPNACNLCHTDRDAGWAERQLAVWKKPDYQRPVLARARLIDAARRQDWSQLEPALRFLADQSNPALFRASLVRLLRVSRDNRLPDALLPLLSDPSPLVRAAAVEALAERIPPEGLEAAARLAEDPVRLVRVRAAAALAGAPGDLFQPRTRAALVRAWQETEQSFGARPDDWANHYNLGNFRLSRGEIEPAIQSFETALRLEPRSALALTNISLAYSRQGKNDLAEASLRKAIQVDPANAAACFNLGLLLGETGRTGEAEAMLREALKADPTMAQAAYNLGVLLLDSAPASAVEFCRKAWELDPEQPRYGYSYAFSLLRNRQLAEASAVLEEMLRRWPSFADARSLLEQLRQAGPTIQ